MELYKKEKKDSRQKGAVICPACCMLLRKYREAMDGLYKEAKDGNLESLYTLGTALNSLTTSDEFLYRALGFEYACEISRDFKIELKLEMR